MRRCQAAGRDCLGRAVALAHLNGRLVVIEELVELLLQLDRQTVAAGEYALERAEVRPVHARQAQQRFVKRRHAGDEVALVLHDLLGVALGRKARDQDAASALREHRVHTHAEAEAVEERHRRQHTVTGAEHRVRRDDLLAEGIEILVRQHDALCCAGRTAGIEDHGGVRALALDLIGLIVAGAGELHEVLPHDDRRVLRDLLDLASLGEHIARLDRRGQRVAHACDDHVDDLRALAHLFKLVVELIERHRRHAFRGVEIKLDLLLRRQRMDHVRNAADEVDGVEHIDGLRAVRHGDGHLVALAHADGLERLGALLDLADHLAVSRRLSHKGKGDVARIFLGDLLHGLEHRAVEVFKVHRHLAHRILPRGLYDRITHSLPPPTSAAPEGRGAPADT